MNRKTTFMLLYGAALFALPAGSAEAASSANFSIPTSVLGGGGGSSSSANFQTDATAGQPTPVMDPTDPPQSTSYDNLPGFWYTTGAAACGDLASFAAAFGRASGEPGYSGACDLDLDGDVDGKDLAAFATP